MVGAKPTASPVVEAAGVEVVVEEVEVLVEELLVEVLPEELPEEEPLLFPHPATEAAMVQAASTQKIRFRLEFAFIMIHSFLIRLARVPLIMLTNKL